jgi:DnaJ-class molecular chaperone
MAHLVYCPTCDGKMSSNAEKCPHCGETQFEKHYSNGYKLGTCRECNGKGTTNSKKHVHGINREYPTITCVVCKGSGKSENLDAGYRDIRKPV